MAIEKFIFKAGESRGVDESGAEIWGSTATTCDPDWVTLPHALGGGRANVIRSTLMNCPHGCQQKRTALELDRVYPVGDGEKSLAVIECPVHGFLWVAHVSARGKME